MDQGKPRAQIGLPAKTIQASRSTLISDLMKVRDPNDFQFLGRKGVRLTKVYNKGRIKILNKIVSVVNSTHVNSVH